jgi:hypothetical protein
LIYLLSYLTGCSVSYNFVCFPLCGGSGKISLVSSSLLKSSLHMVKGAESLVQIKLHPLAYAGAISSFLELKFKALVLSLKQGGSSVGFCNRLASFTQDL